MLLYFLGLFFHALLRSVQVLYSILQSIVGRFSSKLKHETNKKLFTDYP